MVKLPPEFTATKFPGYFWNTKNHKLYSIKIGGELRELHLTYPNHFNRIDEPGYRVSCKGRRTWLMESYLTKLPLEDSWIPVKSEN